LNPPLQHSRPVTPIRFRGKAAPAP
jgi:hypothetical protein